MIGGYGKSFMVGLIPGLSQSPQEKTGKLGLSMTQKIDTIIDFFPTIDVMQLLTFISLVFSKRYGGMDEEDNEDDD